MSSGAVKPRPPQHVSPYRNAPRIFGLRFKVASRVMLLFEAILGKLMLVLSICSIIYSPSWYPVIVNFLFLFFLISSIVCYNLCLSRKSSIYAFPFLSYELVSMFWLLIWLYAALNAVASGVMWSLEWLGGPVTSRVPTSHDIRHVNYANPYETHPETSRAIKWGCIIAAVCVLLITLKLFAFIIARRTFFQVRRMELEELEDKIKVGCCETESEISNIGGTSPAFPVAIRNRPSKRPMAVLEEVQCEEYTPQPSPAPRRMLLGVPQPVIVNNNNSNVVFNSTNRYSPVSQFEESEI